MLLTKMSLILLTGMAFSISMYTSSKFSESQRAYYSIALGKGLNRHSDV
jgi:hypothetical protein